MSEEKPPDAAELAEAWKLQQAGNQSEAANIYRQFLAVNPGHARAWAYLGLACDTQQQLEEAADAYRQALALDPGFFLVWNNLGSVCLRRSMLRNALACFDEALAIDPRSGAARTNKALALEWLGKPRA